MGMGMRDRSVTVANTFDIVEPFGEWFIESIDSNCVGFGIRDNKLDEVVFVI